MRLLILLLVTTLCASTAFADPTKELQLLLTSKGSGAIALGDPMELEMRLRNVSDQPVAVVRPGDGSESGWREPSMYFSAEKKTAHGWQNVERRPIGRCGLYNSNWQDDVVVLKPGEEIDVGVWMPTPYSYFNLSEGTYRFRLHYNYTRGEAEKKSLGNDAEVPPSLVDTPAFSLVSEPLIYKINPVHTQQSKCSPTKPTARRPSRPGDGPAGS